MTKEEEEYEKESKRLDAELKLLLTDDFLATLIIAAKTIGWLVDFTEVQSFVRECFCIAEKEFNDFEPFQNP